MALPPGNFTFLIDDTTGDFLLDDAGNFYLIADVGPPGTGDFITYIFQFPDRGAAGRDQILQFYFFDPQTAVEVLVYADVTVNSVITYPGYWFMVMKNGGLDPNLYTHPNLEMVVNRTALLNGLPSLINSNIPAAHVNVTANAVGTFIQNGVS